MTETPPPAAPRQTDRWLEPGQTNALVIYILYLAGLVIGISGIAGIIIAYINRGKTGGWLESHYTFLIRTFWIGILYLVIGTILAMVLVGIAVLLWWFIWSLVRNIKGALALNDNKPIANPGSWLFG